MMRKNGKVLGFCHILWCFFRLRFCSTVISFDKSPREEYNPGISEHYLNPEEAHMRMKAITVVTIVLIFCGGMVAADTPSVFDVGLVNYYSISDLSETDFEAYTPGVRMQVNITPWFGLSGDVVWDQPIVDVPDDVYNFSLAADVAVRWPLGFFEPYFALGPAYRFVLDDEEFTMEPIVMANARAGFDFNITPVFTLGVEASLYVPDLEEVVAGTQTLNADYFMDNTYVGLSFKGKF